MFFQILGSIAEFEHALMSERTVDGLTAARARGRTGGQKPKLGPRQVTLAQQMYDETDNKGANARTPWRKSPPNSGIFAESRHINTATPDNTATATMSTHAPLGIRHSAASSASTAVIPAVNPICAAVKINESDSS